MSAPNTKCPQCLKEFATELQMRQHFNEKHRNASTAQAVDGDGPDSMVEPGAVPVKRCGNCLYFGKANNITVCRRDPGTAGLAQGPGGVMVPVCFHPPKFKNDWCGQWLGGSWDVEKTSTEALPPA